MTPGCGSSGSDGSAVSQGAATPVVQTPVATPAPAGNRAPTISGVPATNAKVGEEYSFSPDWNDADGDALTFTANNLPPWAHLDPKTGYLHGTPGTADVGSYESISISVADASHRVSTRDFTIMVNGIGSGVATLTWPSPVSKVDGSLLDDLAGYRILYGRDPEDLDHSVFIADPDAHSYEFATLDSGTWYFAIVAVNAGGEEGPATMPAKKII